LPGILKIIGSLLILQVILLTTGQVQKENPYYDENLTYRFGTVAHQTFFFKLHEPPD
jgi:hypothetical protein